MNHETVTAVNTHSETDSYCADLKCLELDYTYALNINIHVCEREAARQLQNEVVG